jgi:hypothetical protein
MVTYESQLESSKDEEDARTGSLVISLVAEHDCFEARDFVISFSHSSKAIKI